MSSELKLEISPIDEREMQHNPQSIVAKLDETNLLFLQEYILDNLPSLDGGPSVSNLSLTNFRFDTSKLNGSFRLKFQIERQYCCSDIESCANDYLDFDFKLQEKTLIAKAEYFDWSLTN
ncbi:hypothetical protein [Sphingobacterium composti Ten et al. 2007 non Yoo et al. 2007]|uniref:hypothetical protein n=1 Tax=Sphingobacterium composti TaxID=363260 RepID=UPI001356CF33|nr:hypothetical protein [Sphingobacterium composti Ten et al. 2007 non Yoo et al. 2007]